MRDPLTDDPELIQKPDIFLQGTHTRRELFRLVTTLRALWPAPRAVYGVFLIFFLGFSRIQGLESRHEIPIHLSPWAYPHGFVRRVERC